MTQKLYRYRPAGAPVEDDRVIMRWFPVGEEPDEVQDQLETWLLDPEVPRPTTQQLKKTVEGFVSYQMPKWWPYAPRHDAKGRCVFHSRREAEEACKKARDDGEQVIWDY